MSGFLYFALLVKYYWGGKVKEYEISGVYGTQGGGGMHAGFDWKSLRTQTAGKEQK